MNTQDNEKKGRYIHGRNIKNSTIRRNTTQRTIFLRDHNKNPF